MPVLQAHKGGIWGGWVRFDYVVGLRRSPVGREFKFQERGGMSKGVWSRGEGGEEVEHIYRVCLGLEKGQLIFWDWWKEVWLGVDIQSLWVGRWHSRELVPRVPLLSKAGSWVIYSRVRVRANEGGQLRRGMQSFYLRRVKGLTLAGHCSGTILRGCVYPFSTGCSHLGEETGAHFLI